MPQLLRAALTVDKSPYQQDDHCTHDGTDKTGLLTSVIPADGLAEIGRDDGTDNAEDRRENDALGFLLAGRNEFGNHSSNEADNDGPKKAEHGFPQVIIVVTDYSYYPSACALGQNDPMLRTGVG